MDDARRRASVILAGCWWESRAPMFVSHGPFIPHRNTTAVLGCINTTWGCRLGVGREESHTVRLSDARALGPRLREDDGCGNSEVCV